MKPQELIQSQSIVTKEGVSYLPPRDSEIPKGSSDFSYDQSIPGATQKLKSHRLKRITDEDRHGFTIRFPDGRFPSTKFIIIHTRQVIMNEGKSMDKLDSDDRMNHHLIPMISGRLYKMFISEECENGSESFPGSFYRISKCRFEGRFHPRSNSISSIKKMFDGRIHDILVFGKPGLYGVHISYIHNEGKIFVFKLFIIDIFVILLFVIRNTLVL